jgi:sec-independent protein translocase protein TatA
MPHLGMTELFIILVIVLIIFGVGRLPQVGRGIGQGIREFRESINSLKKDDNPPVGRQDSGASEELKH